MLRPFLPQQMHTGAPTRCRSRASPPRKAYSFPRELKPSPFCSGKTPCPELPAKQGWEERRVWLPRLPWCRRGAPHLPGLDAFWIRHRTAAGPQDLMAYLYQCLLSRNRACGVRVLPRCDTGAGGPGSVLKGDLRPKPTAPSLGLHGTSSSAHRDRDKAFRCEGSTANSKSQTPSSAPPPERPGDSGLTLAVEAVTAP